MNKSSLPYGLKPYEIGYLILLGAAYWFTGINYRGELIPVIGVAPWVVFGVAVALGLVILAGRCPEQWRQLPNKGMFITLTVAWVALFVFLGNSTLGYVRSSSLFAWMFDVFTSPDSDEEFGLLIPFAVLALFWWKREQLLAKPLGAWWPGILMIAAGLLLHLVGHGVQEAKLSLIGFLIGLYGVTGLAWGKNWLKASGFPFFLLFFCIPVGGLLDGFTFHLRLLVAWIVAGIAHLGLSPDLVRNGTQLMDAQHTFGYDVAPACSGIRSLTALLALSVVYGFIVFKTPSKRLILILSAIPLAVLGNVVRLCCTIIVAELGGQAAGKAVETKFGFITFLVAIVCMFLIAQYLEKAEQKIESSGNGHPGEVAA